MSRYQHSDDVLQPPQYYFDLRQDNLTQPSSQSKTGRRRSHQSGNKNNAIESRFRANVSQFRLTTISLLAIATALTSLAFFSSNWLEAEHRYYGSKFRKLGLWRFCFNSFSAPDDYTFKKFYVGCRWLFADDYKIIRSYLLPSVFLSKQQLLLYVYI